MDLVIAAAGWLILALLATVVLACAGRAGRDADLRLGYDGDAPPVGCATTSADRRTGRLERL